MQKKKVEFLIEENLNILRYQQYIYIYIYKVLKSFSTSFHILK